MFRAQIHTKQIACAKKEVNYCTPDDLPVNIEKNIEKSFYLFHK